MIRNLQGKGISVLFVGHKLNEVFEIADRVTILRDGRKVGTYSIHDLNNERLIELMTGKRIDTAPSRSRREGTSPLLEIKNLTKRGQFENVSFTLHADEIIGIIGLVGAGRTELALSIFGLNPPDDGEIFIEGKKQKIVTVQDAMNCGIGYVPEDRLTQGLFMGHTIKKNMIVTLLDFILNKFLLLDSKKISRINDNWINELGIKTPSSELAVKQLSGGNQQRVVLSKWLERNPKILVLDGPTIGIDVGAKEEIHAIIKRLAEKGMGILMISDEVSEVIHHSDRILLMKEGKITDEFDAHRITESALLMRLGEK